MTQVWAWAADVDSWNHDSELWSAIAEKQTQFQKDGAEAGLAIAAADFERLHLGEPQVLIREQNRSILVTSLQKYL